MMSDVTSRCSLPTNRESAMSKRWSGGAPQSMKPHHLFNIPFHLEIHHKTEVSCNFRFTGTLILIFFKVLKL